MTWLALLSGLIGAVASSVFAYFVRARLDARALRIAETRLAFVYLVQVSEIVALTEVIKSFVTRTFPSGTPKDLRSEDGKYEAHHKLIAMLASVLSKAPIDTIRADPRSKAIPRFARTMIEDTKELQLTAEQLSRLPQE